MSEHPPADWVNGAAAHALALLLACHRYGPGVDMGGAHNPTPGEEREAARYVRDLLDNGWLDPVRAEAAERSGYRKAITALRADAGLDMARKLLRDEGGSVNWAAKVASGLADWLESIAEEVHGP